MDKRKENTEVSSVDSFLSELEGVSAATQEPRKKKKAKKNVAMTVLRMGLIAIFAGVFCWSGYMIVSNLVDGFEADSIYSEMNDDFFDGLDRTGLVEYLSPAVLDKATLSYGSYRPPSTDHEFVTVQTNNPFFAQFKNKLLQYQEKNSDIYGWMQVEGTNISYACGKGEDNDYYLDHTATREFNVHGAIFADFRCEDDLVENKNLIFYGHNSAYIGHMFHQLTRFLDKSFFEEHKYVTIYSFSGVYKYEIFSIYETEATYKYCQFSFETDEEFIEWCNEMKNNSIYKRETPEFTPQTKILTLSTCTNGEETHRYSVQARLVSVENNEE